MHGREVYREAVSRMSEAARGVLAKAGRDLESVSLIVPQQANLRIIRAVAKALGAPFEKVFVNVQEHGPTAAGRSLPGDLVLLTTFGAGFHWAAAWCSSEARSHLPAANANRVAASHQPRKSGVGRESRRGNRFQQR